MLSAYLVVLASLLFSSATLASPAADGLPIEFAIYEEWGTSDCSGAFTNNGSFPVGNCYTFPSPAAGITFQPTDFGSPCSVVFYTNPGCGGVQSEAIPLGDQGCIATDGVFRPGFPEPPVANSAVVICGSN
ncbi:hypothetical protein K488DRAFT_70121 [Vararia minispora EC-137]|uniref:Uncharacterized protein n=1 Tax=Vararia minispora EC-137 TaxID=1314806 RepID=A0ACB8QMQ8_9AGAM|nr:hypothetical protein K488DRAFT_70121 [Vararia minispora EC-137]